MKIFVLKRMKFIFKMMTELQLDLPLVRYQVLDLLN